MSLQASIVSVHGPPRLYFESLKLLSFYLNADQETQQQVWPREMLNFRKLFVFQSDEKTMMHS